MIVVWWLLGALAALAGTFFLGMRNGWRPVTGAVRRVNKRLFNPYQMRTAGRPGAYAGIVRHVGRRSGRQYETPVGVEPTPDGFVIACPYGTTADWLANVLAAGSAELVWEGETHAVRDPELVGLAEAVDYFPESDRTTFRSMRIDTFLLLRKA